MTISGVLLAVAALFILTGAIVIALLQAALNKLDVDLVGYIAAVKAKDIIIADQAAEIERLTANQADPAVIDAMTAQVNSMDAKLF